MAVYLINKKVYNFISRRAYASSPTDEGLVYNCRNKNDSDSGMKKSKLPSLFLLIALTVFACGGKEKPTPGGPSGVLLNIRDAVSFDDLMKCYSSDTRAVMKRLIKRKIVPKERARSLLAILDKDSSWEVVSEKTTKTSIVILVEITDHRIENRAGEQMQLLFVNENGLWVIDMAGDLRSMEEMHKKSDADTYLRKQFREYQ